MRYSRRLNNGFIVKHRYIIITALLFLLNLSYIKAQMFDSISIYMQRKPHLTGSLSSSFSFVNGLRAPVYSLTGAVSFSGKFRIGLGFNWLSLPEYDVGNPQENTAPFYRTNYVISTDNQPDTCVSKLSLKYLGYYADYLFFKSRRWECAVKLQLGIGKAGYHPLMSNSLFGKNDKPIFVYEPSISLQYHFFRWLGLGMRSGFRFVLGSEKWVWQNFNSPTYDLGLQIYYDQLYKLLFPRTKLAQRL